MKSHLLRPKINPVIGPDGMALSVKDMPHPNTGRWVIRRKAIVVYGVRGGLLSVEEVCTRYSLTVDEYLGWERAIDEYGLAGLRTTQIQAYRDRMPPQKNPESYPLLKKFADLCEAREAASSIILGLTASVDRLELNVRALNLQVERLEGYLKARMLPEGEDLALSSLRSRRCNLTHSIDTLRTRETSAKEEKRLADEQVSFLENMIREALDEKAGATSS